MACKGFSTDSLKSTSVSSVLFPDSICFWTSAEYQVVNISALYEGYMLMAILKIVLRKCYRNSFRKMSQMIRNKDMRWTKIWALLLVCVIQADAKLKWRFFKVNKFRGFYFRGSFFAKFFKSRKSRKLSLANIRDNKEHHLARQYNFARISVHKDDIYN